MKTTLKDTTFNQFFKYCEENKKLDNYAYINKNVLEIVYKFCCKQNLRVEGIKCRMFWDIEKECISYISNFLNSTPTEESVAHLESLFHEVWCKTEWAARCLTRDTFGKDSVKSTFGNKTCKEILAAI